LEKLQQFYFFLPPSRLFSIVHLYSKVMSGEYNPNHQSFCIDHPQGQPQQQTQRPTISPSITAAQTVNPSANKPRKFRNKFVPSFQNPKKPKNSTKSSKKSPKLHGKTSSASSSTSSTSSSSSTLSSLPQNQTTLVKGSVSKQQIYKSSQYLDHLKQFEIAEKRRLEQLKKDVLELTSRPSINNLAVKAHGGFRYPEFHDFHSQYATKVLAVGDPSHQKLWDTYVPQLAYNSAMVSNALVAYDSLYLSRKKLKRDQNLEKMASEHFFTSIQDLMKAMNNISSINLFELYVTSYLVAAFAIATPDQVPLVSVDQTKPELFRIIRGVFNPYFKSLFAQDHTNSFWLPKLEIPTSLESLDPKVLSDPNFSLFKLLWDQLDSMEAGSTSIEILSNPNYTTQSSPVDPVETSPLSAKREPSGLNKEQSQDVLNDSNLKSSKSHFEYELSSELDLGNFDDGCGSYITTSDIYPQHSDVEMAVYDTLSSTTSSSSYGEHSDFSSPEESLNSPPEADPTTAYNAFENAISSKQTLATIKRPPSFQTTNKIPPPLSETDPTLFKLLPGEALCYRKAVYDIIHVASGSTMTKSTSVLVVAFNAINDKFMEFLRARRPMALVIVAYLICLYWFKDRYLYKDGTYLRRMQEAMDMAPECWKPAFYWPQQILGKHQVHSSLERMMEEMEISK
jgi:hypothetical protein